MPMRMRGSWPRLALIVAVTIELSWCCQFSLQHGLAASVGIALGKVERCLQSLGTLWPFAVCQVEKADIGKSEKLAIGFFAHVSRHNS